MTGPVRARYFDGIGARGRDATAEVDGEDLVIRDAAGGGAELDRWPRAELYLRERPVRDEAVFGTGAADSARLVVVGEHSISVVLAAAHPRSRGRRADRRDGLRVALWIAAALGSAALLLLYGIPLAAERIAAVVPASVRVSMGEAAADQLAGFIGLAENKGAAVRECRNRPGQSALDRLVARLQGQAPELDVPLRVRVLDLDLVNAFAVPGGLVLVTRGMIEYAESPEALAGTIAHEIGHVVHRHPTAGWIAEGGAALLLGLVVGDVSGGVAILALGQTMLSARYSQEAEREADAFAIEVMNRTDIDLRPTARFFDRLVEDFGDVPDGLAFLSTHPLSRARADAALAAGTGRGRAMGDEDWQALLAICG